MKVIPFVLNNRLGFPYHWLANPILNWWGIYRFHFADLLRAEHIFQWEYVTSSWFIARLSIIKYSYNLFHNLNLNRFFTCLTPILTPGTIAAFFTYLAHHKFRSSSLISKYLISFSQVTWSTRTARFNVTKIRRQTKESPWVIPDPYSFLLLAASWSLSTVLASVGLPYPSLVKTQTELPCSPFPWITSR